MSSNVTYREGDDFFKNTCQVVAFVCNCTSERSIGFGRRVEEHFPYVDINQNRDQKPGTIELWGKSNRNQRYVLGLFAQYSRADTHNQGLEWFKTCLEKIKKQLPALKSIAFPRRTTTPKPGCSYLKAIESWAEGVPHIKVEIVSVGSPQERYSTTPPPVADLKADRVEASTSDEYFETPEYIKIENEVYDWVSRHTNMKAIPTDSEARSQLATSLSELLLKMNPDLHSKIKALVPVADDFFSILEQESSPSDLN